MKKSVYWGIGLTAVFLGITFALKNPELVDIRYYFGVDFSAPVSVVLLITFLLGSVAGYLAALAGRLRLRRELNKEKKEKLRIEKELAAMRALPIKDAV